MEELKPCPFCPDGGNPKHIKIIYHSCESNLIKCMKCEASICGYDTKEEAIAAWNTRAEDTDVPTKERTCHVQVRKRGMIYDVFYFDCCDKEWVENRNDSRASRISGDVCPYCGAKVMDE